MTGGCTKSGSGDANAYAYEGGYTHVCASCPGAFSVFERTAARALCDWRRRDARLSPLRGATEESPRGSGDHDEDAGLATVPHGPSREPMRVAVYRAG